MCLPRSLGILPLLLRVGHSQKMAKMRIYIRRKMVGLKQPLHNRVLPTSACHSRYFMCVCSCHSKFIISDYVGIHTRINSLNTASCLIYIYTFPMCPLYDCCCCCWSWVVLGEQHAMPGNWPTLQKCLCVQNHQTVNALYVSMKNIDAVVNEHQQRHGEKE